MKNLSTIFSMIVLVALTVLLSSSKPVMTNCPNTPAVTASTNQVSYIHATALLRQNVDGFHWTVQGGFIMSGQGTHTISIGPDCPSGIITACVRAYFIQPNEELCYSDEDCNGVNYTGPCFY